MNKSRDKDDYSERGMSIQSNISKMTTFTSMRSTRRQYLSLKKNRSINSNTVYTNTSPIKNKRSRLQYSSLSPDRKSLYWQNCLLPEGVRKQITFTKPQTSSQSICAIFSDTNQVFFSQNCNQPKQIASLTKIMTAFTVINICNTFGLKVRDIPIIIQKEASMMQGTTANLRYGDQLYVIDLFYGLLLPSGNDAAIALAQYFGKFLSFAFANQNQKSDIQGQEAIQNFQQQSDFYDTQYQNESIKLFVFQMNKNCHKIGLKKTQFTNPTGLTDSRNYSTAYQIAKLTSFCMKNHLLRSIFKKKVYICEVKNQKLATIRKVEWRNTNTNLYKVKDCIGVKTGITPGAGPCLSSAYRIMGRQLIIIVLKSKTMQDRFADSQKIYRYARSKLHNT